MNSIFKVTYLVKTTLDKSGEFLSYHNINKYTRESESNDLNEIFTDLFDLHRFDSILAIEIIEVKKTRSISDNELEMLYVSESGTLESFTEYQQ